MRNISLASLAFVFFFISCKEDKITPVLPVDTPKQIEVRVQPVFGAQSVEPEQVYTTAEGYDVKFTEIKFYCTTLKNGVHTLVDAALFDWNANGTKFIKVNADKNNFASISGNLGVGAAENHADPSAFAPANPLNIAIANDMHWDWNPGYIFVKVEAKVDTIPDGIPLFDHNVVLHAGKDDVLQTVLFEEVNWVMLNEYLSLFSLKLDMETFLQNAGQNIDLKTEYSLHSAPGQEALATKVMQNFKAALKKL